MPTPQHRTLITIATYNEIENLPKLVEAIFDVAPDIDLLVVDDNSPDGTGEWSKKKAEEDPRVRCIHREGKLGLGSATIAAMRYAIDNDYEFMLNLDADFSHHPRYMSDILGRATAHENPDKTQREPKADIVIGSRYTKGGGVVGWPLKRKFMSRGVNLYARILLGLSTKDCSGSFRCYRIDALRKIDFDGLRSQGYSFLEEVLWLMKRNGALMTEVPITFEDRRWGTSKINAAEARAAIVILFRLGIKNWLRI